MTRLTRAVAARRDRQPRGFAIALFLVIMVVLFGMTAVVALSVQSSTSTSGRAQDNTQGREAGLSALDSFYAQLETDPTLQTQVSQATVGQATVIDPTATAMSGVDTNRWERLDHGLLVPCVDATTSGCYQIQATRVDSTVGTTPGSQGEVSSNPSELAVQATVRTGCNGTRCTYTRLQMHLRKRQFFDFLFYFKYTVLDPALDTSGQESADCAARYATRTDPDKSGAAADPRSAVASPGCVDVAFQGNPAAGKDVIQGPVYTDDDYIGTCGNPDFEAPVYVAGEGSDGSAFLPATSRGDSCTGTPTYPADGVHLNSGALGIPDFVTSAARFKTLTQTAYQFTPAVAGTPVTITIRDSGSTSVLDVSGSTSNATGLPLPSNEMVYVNGDANISGTLAGELSVFVAGTAHITANLTYAGGQTGADLLGLTAENSVVVDPICTLGSSCTAGQIRYVDAIILSMKHEVNVAGWDQVQFSDPTLAPTLDFYGAMASEYQGVYGSYDQDDGQLVSGYKKNFTYDSRLSSGLLPPPYMLSPATNNWIKLDVSEVGSCGGLDLGPAPVTSCGVSGGLPGGGDGTHYDAPAAPSTPALSLSGTSINLTWTAPANSPNAPLSGYNIYRSTTPTGTYTQVAGTSTTSYADPVAANTQFCYQVSARGPGGESPQSADACLTSPPAAPTNVTASQKLDGTIAIAWTASAGATSYQVYRSADNVNWSAVGTSASTSYTDTTAASNETLYYQITAKNAAGSTSPRSATATVLVQDTPGIPDPPGKPSVTITGATIQVIWTAPPFDPTKPLTGYRIYTSSTPAGPYLLLAQQTGVSRVDDAQPNTSYCYAISSYGPNGESAISAVTCTMSPTLAPTNLKATTGTYKTVKLSWDAPTGAVSYQLYRSADGTHWSLIATPSATSYTDPNLVPWQTVYYEVAAVNVGGAASPFSVMASAVPTDAEADFAYTGTVQTWTVPDGVHSIIADVYGAQGGSVAGTADGGQGGHIQAMQPVTSGQVLYIYVGGAGVGATPGYNGGGAGSTDGQAGGGASDIRTAAGDLSTRLVVAGGGGGGAGTYAGPAAPDATDYAGGAGGGTAAGTGIAQRSFDGTTYTSNQDYAGGGGTQSIGGASGTGGAAGATGQGGDGAAPGGGAGGGGYFGGGAGGTSAQIDAGGGGGSSYASGTIIVNARGVRTGDGAVTITPVGSNVAAFGFTGAVQTYVVPTGVTSVTIDARGAQGGTAYVCDAGGYGGTGGEVKSTLAVYAGQTLYVYVGGQGTQAAAGYNGGGAGGPAGTGGGGGTDVRTSTTLASRIIVAGGGGGGAANFQPGSTCTVYPAGAGGGTTGGAGGGGGGTQSSGGAAGGYGSTGSLGQGASVPATLPGSGGAGGGYYGGGTGGGLATGGSYYGIGGAGGSSYTATTPTVNVQGGQAGDGSVLITATQLSPS